MLVVAGFIGMGSAVGGVALSAVVPRLATGPVIVLFAAVIFFVSCLVAPRRGLLARVARSYRNQGVADEHG